MSVIELSGGGEAWVLSAEVDRLSLAASRAYPPGATLVGTLASRTVRVKVRGSKLRATPPTTEPTTPAEAGASSSASAGTWFDVEGRLVDATRADRELVLAHVLERST